MTTFWIVVLISNTALFALFCAVGLLVQRRQGAVAPAGTLTAGVSVILPIKGLDPGAAEHYRNWLTQKLPVPYEVIFSLQEPDDPVLPILQRLLAEPGAAHARVLVNPVRPGLNGKASNLWHGVNAARYDLFVMADSDIAPTTDLLGRLVPPLSDPRNGLVACLPVARRAANFWGGVNALTLNLALTAQWATMQAFGVGAGMVGVPGACFAIRRDVLEAVGGLEAFGGYVAEDAEMGRRVAAGGHGVRLGPAVTLEQGEGSFPFYFGLISRGAHLNLYGYGGLPLASTVVTLFTHMAVLVGGLLTANPRLVSVAALVWLVRAGVGALLQVGSEGGRGWRYAWTMPVMEILFAWAFLWALISPTFVWRGIRYRVRRGGRIEHV